MAAARFVAQLNAQIANELAAHNQYLACAVYYDALTMPQIGFVVLRARRSRSATTR